MLGGTGSDVGKSVIATGLCRVFLQDGYHPCPFKAQNMALNSAATPDGKEIGRAQATQAEACGLEPDTDMNPILLKPSSDKTSQVVVNGVSIGNRNAYEYYRTEGRENFREIARRSFDRLNAIYNPVVMEGAGSIAEINLKDTDIVNMSMARYAGAAVILVADIDRGGVFASLYGTIQLQSPEDRELIKGIIINKFRGDLKFFDSGRKLIEDICGVPVIGIVPYMSDLNIDEEDSVALDEKNNKAANDKLNIAVVRLKHISNYTDFAPLEQIKEINVYFSNEKKEISKADIVIIPGSKSTISDRMFLKEKGLDDLIVQMARNGRKVWGICGGYQILGKTIEDPDGIEGNVREVDGLGLLPIKTVIQGDKRTVKSRFRIDDASDLCEGYEIHCGKSSVENLKPFCITENGFSDGCIDNEGQIAGTYMHGLFENGPVVRLLLKDTSVEIPEDFNYRRQKDYEYDRIADHLRKYLDLKKLYEIIESND